MEYPGNLFVVAAPSGAGKSSLVKSLLELDSHLVVSISHTTRPPRGQEQNGREYWFISEPEFRAMVEQGDFFEWAEVHGNLYGTSRAAIESRMAAGEDVILEIDVQGADLVMEKAQEAVTIFILPPSFETMRARLIARATEGSSDLDLRLRNSHYEVAQYSKFQYVVINDELGLAARKLASIIIAERQLRDRQEGAIQGILDSFERSKS